MPLLSKDAGRALAYSQVGLEMVAPIVIGILLDDYLQWSPWGVSVGAVLGLVLGVVRLVQLTKPPKKSNNDSSPPSGSP